MPAHCSSFPTTNQRAAIRDIELDYKSSVWETRPQVRRYDFQIKIAYTAVMVRRMLFAMQDPAFIDDRDYYGEKRSLSVLSWLFLK